MSTRHNSTTGDDIREDTAYVNARKMPIEEIRKELLKDGVDSEKEAKAVLEAVRFLRKDDDDENGKPDKPKPKPKKTSV